ncbi:MAG: hypothetical protein RBR65_00080 [Aliarcobacter sp.]|jgi:hypothetical protein|nr:hypothetical protein [Aliarcobacter sp.]
MNNIFGVYIGLITAIFYVIVVFLVFKREPILNDFVTIFLSTFSIYGSVFLTYTIIINTHNKVNLGILNDFTPYIILGASAVIWISFSSIYKIFKSFYYI